MGALRGINGSALTASESDRLADLEGVIERGRQTFLEVGAALAEVRDGRLYRATHATFEDYCRVRWDMSDRRARQLVAATETVRQIGTTVPVSERTIRPLTALPAGERAHAWRDAVESAGSEHGVTSAHVRSAAEARKPRPAREVLPESPMGDDEPETDLVAELEASDARVRELEAQVASLKATDTGREILALHSRVAQTEALLQQARTEAAEARRQAEWSGKLLRKIMRLLGLDDPRAVVARIAELVR